VLVSRHHIPLRTHGTIARRPFHPRYESTGALYAFSLVPTVARRLFKDIKPSGLRGHNHLFHVAGLYFTCLFITLPSFHSHISYHSPLLGPLSQNTAPLCIPTRASVNAAATPNEDKRGTAASAFPPNPYSRRDCSQGKPTSTSQFKPETERGGPMNGFPFTHPEAQHSLSYSRRSLSSLDIASPSDIDIGHELRHPPIDPRRSRRYCTDFGLGPDCGSLKEYFWPPPFLLQASLSSSNRDGASITSGGSTPLATYAGTDSDTSSLYQDIESEFPNPPSSHPALRRMQSSPLFTLEQTSAVREFLRKRWSTKVKTKGDHSNMGVPPLVSPTMSPILDGDHEKWTGRGRRDFSWEAESPICIGFENGGCNGYGRGNGLARELALEVADEAWLRVGDITPVAELKGGEVYQNNRASRIPEDGDVTEDGLSLVLRSLRTGKLVSCRDASKQKMVIRGLGMPLDVVPNPVAQVTDSRDNLDSDERGESITPQNRVPSTSHIGPSQNLLENPSLSKSHKYGRFTPSLTSSRMPHIIRKVVSMRFSPKQHDGPSTLHSHCLPKSRSVKFVPESSNAFDRLELSMEKLKTYQPPQHSTSKSRSFGCGGRESQFSETQPDGVACGRPLSPPSLASAGRKKPSHRPRLSVPLAGFGFSNPTTPGNTLNADLSASSGPRVLAAPFMHRTTRSQPLNLIPPTATKAVQVLKSFIDLTPEQEVRHESSAGMRKERVRKLLARASNGVFGWGKNLTRKGSSA